MSTQNPPHLTGLKFVIRFTEAQTYVGVVKADHDPRLFTYGPVDTEETGPLDEMVNSAAVTAETQWAEAAQYPKYTPPAKPKAAPAKKGTAAGRTTTRDSTTPAEPQVQNNPRLF